jgi:LysR family transcriptional activator of nhaA
MEKWLNYHHLIYFRVIATEGSLSKASEKLKVGQPALSSQLKSFEEYLGVKLFDRVNKRLILTETGKQTLEYANQIHNLGQELLSTIENKKTRSTHHLSVGAMDSIPKHLILDVIEEAKKIHNCHFSIIEGNIHELMDLLSRHELDFIISDHTIQTGSQAKNYCKKFLTSNLKAYGTSKFSDLKKNFPQGLNEMPVILPTDHSQLRFELDQYFLSHDLDVEIVAQTQDTAVQKLLALNGNGVIFLPTFAAKDYIQTNQLIELGELAEITANYFLVSSTRVIKNPALNSIIEQDFNALYKTITDS